MLYFSPQCNVFNSSALPRSEMFLVAVSALHSIKSGLEVIAK